MVNCFESVNPESNPAVLFVDAARYVHGAAKELWVTEWSIPEFGNQNVMVVLFVAVKLAGWNVNVPWKPTSTLRWPVVSAGAEGTAAAAVVVAGVEPPPPP